MNTQVLIEPGTDPDAVEACKDGIERLGTLMPRIGGLVVVKEVMLNGYFPTMSNGQINTDAVFQRAQRYPWENGNFTVMLTSRDLGTASLNFALGLTNTPCGMSILSSARFTYAREMTAITMHEAAHAFGAVMEEDSQYNFESHFPGHCANDCTLQPVVGVSEVDSVVNAIAARPAEQGFCDPCVDYLGRVKRADTRGILVKDPS